MEEKGLRLDVFADDKRPKGSFRLEGPKMVSMVNPAFFDVQRSIAPKAQTTAERVGSEERAVP